jgi:1,4-alpha-glucan branching enzyme
VTSTDPSWSASRSINPSEDPSVDTAEQVGRHEVIAVRFVYSTGLPRQIFRNVRLVGSWDAGGHFDGRWTAAPTPMTGCQLEDGCWCYVAEVQFDAGGIGRNFSWGVRLDGPPGPDLWGIPTEVHDRASADRVRNFTLLPDGDEQRYYLTHCRRLGAQKRFAGPGAAPTIEFSVWAPNATGVAVVAGSFDRELGAANSGYIADDGTGIDHTFSGGEFPLTRTPDGIWRSELPVGVAEFALWDHRPYMFKVTRRDSSVVFRTDLYSRCQLGRGRTDPRGARYNGSYQDLDGTKSCSVVVDPDLVASNFDEQTFPEIAFEPQESFWASEVDRSRPVPLRIEDLVIYELHVGSLGYKDPDRDGDFGDVLDFLDYLVGLGVNAVELLPVLQFQGSDRWGYGTSHPFALEYAAGGRDQLKHVIRACHARGIAVILDVVYNHYHVDAERAEWAYDSAAPQDNIYYWYEGLPTDYAPYEAAAARDPRGTPPGEGGYLDNDSTGYTPRFHEEIVRKWLISSAVALVEDFHVDGLRVDLPQAIYSFNRRHADGVPVAAANAFGAKFLRELTRTVKMVRPDCFLIAEDHSDQTFVTEHPDADGLGFDAAWYSAFYHNLVGDGNYPSYASLLQRAGNGDNLPLDLDSFVGALNWTGHRKVVYHKDHDDAGNAPGTARNMVVAVHGASLDGATRTYAEARCRVVCGLAMLSAGTPMFLMFEEIGSVEPMPYQDFRRHRDDYETARQRDGARMFKFYQDLIRLRRGRGALRSHELETVYVHDANRLVAFQRTDGVDRLVVVASLNDVPFATGYWIPTDRLGTGRWKEIFNSDASIYGGANVGNGSGIIESYAGGIGVSIPSNGFVILSQSQ